MAEQTFNGIVDTNGEWEDLDTLTSLTFSNDVMYTIYIGGVAQVKIDEAVFPVSNENFYYTPTSGGSKLKIKNVLNPMTISVYGAS